MNNTIRLYTYEDAVRLYKQRKAQYKRNLLTAAYNYFISNYILQKIIGVLILVTSIVISNLIHDATTFIILFPFCLMLVFTNRKIFG